MSSKIGRENISLEKQSSGTADIRDEEDVFDDQKSDHDFHYKSLTWQFVSLLMIAEIVSNGMLSLPSTLALIGIGPALVIIIFLGVFGLYTAKLLIDFKLNHPGVHSMGDAGQILGGPIAREILSLGTIIFSIASTGSEILSGQLALSTLSDNALCAMDFALIFAVATFIFSLPRTLGRLSWLGLGSAALIALCGVLAMIAAGTNPVSGRFLHILDSSPYDRAVAVTNPVFAYAGHFMFFILISEMRKPQDAMKAAWCLQGFATVFYVVFAVVLYCHIGNTVESFALLSLTPVWSKITFGVALGNFLITGALYSNVAAKLIFVRLFRHSRHMYKHTIIGWVVWIFLCFSAVAIAFVFTISVPIFSSLIGITASLFASWYTYGIAGFFWLHDTFHLKGGSRGFRRRPVGFVLAVLTVIAGAFICVGGTFVSIKLIVDAYKDGTVGKPFSC